MFSHLRSDEQIYLSLKKILRAFYNDSFLDKQKCIKIFYPQITSGHLCDTHPTYSISCKNCIFHMRIVNFDALSNFRVHTSEYNLLSSHISGSN